MTASPLHVEWCEARKLAQDTFHEAGWARTPDALASLLSNERTAHVEWQRRVAYTQGRAQGLRDALDIVNGGT